MINNKSFMNYVQPVSVDGVDAIVKTGPYLQNLSATEVTVMWITHEKSFSWVEYSESDDLEQTAVDYHDGLVQVNNRINKIRLTGLQPGTSYRYRIVSAEIRGGARVDENLPPGVPMAHFHFGKTVASSVYTFTTPPLEEDTFTMVVFNDLHGRHQIIPHLLDGLPDRDKAFDLAVFNGDMIELMDSEDRLVDRFLDPSVERFGRETPFLFIRGNHEMRGAHSRKLINYFAFPGDKFYNAFTRGPVRIVVLDTGEDKDDEDYEYQGLVAFDKYRKEQRNWLMAEMQTAEYRNAPFRVVLMHIPPWHWEGHASRHCRKMFGDFLNEGNVDLLLAGHTHVMGMYEADENHNFPVLIGGTPHPGERCIIQMSATANQLRSKMVRDDGRLIGEVALSAKDLRNG